MKLPIYILLLLSLYSLLSCSEQNKEQNVIEKKINNRLPKVLYITTGVDYAENDIDLPKGIIVAIQAFNKRGIPVRLEPRNVLYDKNFLFDYNIIILSTTEGYHDVDRKYSLTYMTDSELQNLDSFVIKGGVLICGDNIGRNQFDGTDRLENAEKLDGTNYPLAKTLGLIQEEVNMKGFNIEGNINKELKGEFLKTRNHDLWTLVPKKVISKSLKTLAFWKNKKDSIPAITQNDYGDGIAFLLATSDFLDIGTNKNYWNINQLEGFYNYVADQYYQKNSIEIRLNPWPNTYSSAFCATFNSQGDLDNYKTIINGLNKINIKPTFFVNGQLHDTISDYLKSQNIDLESTGFNYENYQDYNYPSALNDILQNEHMWDKKFKGFRFPYTNPSFSGLLSIDLNNYAFESSISVNNIDFFHGSVFPYNIIITNDNYYKSTNILEIAPTYNDDYYYLKDLRNNEKTNSIVLEKNLNLYKQYLSDFWEHTVKPYNGLMVYIGHPDLIGYDNNTFAVLKDLVDTIKNDNAWITTIDEVANYRNKYNEFGFYINNRNGKVVLTVESKTKKEIIDITIRTNFKPQKVVGKKGNAIIKELNDKYYIVFDAFDGQELVIWK